MKTGQPCCSETEAMSRGIGDNRGHGPENRAISGLWKPKVAGVSASVDDGRLGQALCRASRKESPDDSRRTHWC